MDAYFAVNDLKVGYKTFEGEKSVLDIGDFYIGKGETYGIVGESGSGKTVLALTIMRLLAAPPGIIHSGRITIDGEDLLSKSESEMRKVRGKRISMIFQDPMSTLNPVFTVGEQLRRVIRQSRGCSNKAAEKLTLEMADIVRLPDAANTLGKYPHELSGGQRQRIIIAVALSCGGEFLIADEPTRNLDVTIQAGILKLVAQLQRDLKMTVLFIANNLGLVSAMCSRVGILQRGRIVESGTVREILRTPRHPYTTLLLNAIPNGKGEAQDFGRLPPTTATETANAGCQFASRCPRRIPRCVSERPEARMVEGGHRVACHRAFEEGWAK